MDELKDRFLEETDIKNDEEVVLVIAYGSRINGTCNDHSDLDVLVVTSNHHNARAAMMIDGIHIDINYLTYEQAESEIIYGRTLGDTYIESVLATGEVLVDKNNTYEYLINLLDVKSKKNRVVNSDALSFALDYAENYLFGIGSRNVNYYSALEALRGIIHVIDGASNIRSSLVLKLYNNRNLARDLYHVKLPNEEFTKEYLDALVCSDEVARKNYLIKFMKMVSNVEMKSGKKTVFYDDKSIKMLLISLNNLVCKCEEILISDSPYKDAMYFTLLGKLKHFYNTVFEDIIYEFDETYDHAVEVIDENERIQMLETLFSLLDRPYKMDYDCFYLSL